ncbi:efflux RND transporter periplasmic adaptor subunit [Chitinophaga terrae (ex Kim and Jung 2007)]|jgi:membrane fusion protein (multidrug efflux system)|nr:efflux RND transporter periplasmic adaptor subunit [Chitinophaga terrae (ex Kim and Jung 2007)]MDQ0106251.1 membrane fusion protein (multidrug efflux system) [Chitinophaga terrae (ex Kim and Jung 2007)]GEP92109.1 hemolysin D [Chitinophaga terrae (ex Kim and Jung 2007)]
MRKIVAAMLLLGILGACKSKKGGTATQGIKSYPVITVQRQKAVINSDYPATIQGIQNIEIRPKIDGYVEAIYVDEGATVKKGQLLFKINAPQYEQNVNTAKANIKIAIADVNAATMQVNKVKPLVEKDIVSAYELESAQYTLQSKQAALAQAQAAYQNALTNLSYTTIYSPADGVIGILPYKIGSLVNSNTTNPLTTVSDISQIYAYFSINERQGLDFFLSSKGTTMQEKLKTLPPVSLVLANGIVLPKPGRVETASGLINPQTGALNMRATFENPDGLVRSGSSAIVRIPQPIDTALLVPQKSTYQIQGKLFVYVLDADNKVRSVDIGSNVNAAGQSFVVQHGLKPGDKIVVDGIGSLREDQLIAPRPVNADSLFKSL